MPPPTALKIKTSSVARLIKEEQSYHKEIALQKTKIEQMTSGGDDIYEINQQKKVLKDTEQMIPELHSKLSQAIDALEIELENGGDLGETDNAAAVLQDARKLVAGNATSAASDLFTDVS
ncbi:hypothetical protein ABW21_db0208965 [Orbilia brochopaga]|nr:hypothetical protein ABW21_db0208965 [Drechslerella brochopaga]